MSCDGQEMECPTPCCNCGALRPLNELAFATNYCRCDPFGDCCHGLCESCFEILSSARDELDRFGFDFDLYPKEK